MKGQIKSLSHAFLLSKDVTHFEELSICLVHTSRPSLCPRSDPVARKISQPEKNFAEWRVDHRKRNLTIKSNFINEFFSLLMKGTRKFNNHEIPYNWKITYFVLGQLALFPP